MSNYYYVYILTDPRSQEPFYIGKGKGNRMHMHQLEACNANFPNKPHHDRIVEIIDDGLTILYTKIIDESTEVVALDLERKYIEKIGRVNQGSGPLLNITAGGQQGGNASARPINQYDLDGKFVASWKSAKEASERTSANRSYITQVCKRKQKSAGGFLWCYTGETPPIFSKKYYTPVIQYSIDNRKIAKFISLTEAQTTTGVELHNISECCRGKSKTAGGFIWKYLETY